MTKILPHSVHPTLPQFPQSQKPVTYQISYPIKQTSYFPLKRFLSESKCIWCALIPNKVYFWSESIRCPIKNRYLRTLYCVNFHFSIFVWSSAHFWFWYLLFYLLFSIIRRRPYHQESLDLFAARFQSRENARKRSMKTTFNAASRYP